MKPLMQDGIELEQRQRMQAEIEELRERVEANQNDARNLDSRGSAVHGTSC